MPMINFTEPLALFIALLAFVLVLWFSYQSKKSVITGIMLFIFIAILVLIGIVYIRNDMFYINPFLNLLGYNFYQVTFTLNNSSQTQVAKFLFKGQLKTKHKYNAKLSHENFSIIEKF